MLLEVSQKKGLILQLGRVNMTSDHDYRQFCYAVLIATTTILIFIWSWVDGLLAEAYSGVGLGFAVVFSLLLTTGLFIGLHECWRLSCGLNSIKHANELDDLKHLFGFTPDSKVSIEYLSEVVRDNLSQRSERIVSITNWSVLAGLFGTVYGMVLALRVLVEVRSAEDVFRVLPEISQSLSVSFYTTLVGIAVYVPTYQMARLVRSASINLKNKIFRVLEQEGAQK